MAARGEDEAQAGFGWVCLSVGGEPLEFMRSGIGIINRSIVKLERLEGHLFDV